MENENKYQSLMAGSGPSNQQGGLMSGGTVANMISNMQGNSGMMGGDLNSFMQAPMQAPIQGGGGMPAQQPIGNSAVDYMRNQQQPRIAQQQAPTDFLSYANSVRPPAPPAISQEDIDKKNNQKISYMHGDGESVDTTYGELSQPYKDEYDRRGFISYR